MSNINNMNQNLGFCKYKDMFGKPREGLRRYRIFDVSIMDAVVVIVFVYIFTYFTKYSFWPSLAVTFLLGIFAHRLFCVRTRVDKILFPDETTDNNNKKNGDK
jgi:hypothetical protein